MTMTNRKTSFLKFILLPLQVFALSYREAKLARHLFSVIFSVINCSLSGIALLSSKRDNTVFWFKIYLSDTPLKPKLALRIFDNLPPNWSLRIRDRFHRSIIGYNVIFPNLRGNLKIQ